jgi:hypothetical protein
MQPDNQENNNRIRALYQSAGLRHGGVEIEIPT